MKTNFIPENLRSLRIIILGLLITLLHNAYAQDSIVTDSTTTPFRKGRWLTGISGVINSSKNQSESTGLDNSSNEYALNIVGGNFFKDRWLIGGIIQMERSDADGLTDLNTETLFLGPVISHYLSDSNRGALYLYLSPGYSRYRNLVRFTEDQVTDEESTEGSGFGILIGLGYTYVVFDRIAFDIGVGITQRWLTVERTLKPEEIVFSDNINLRNIGFSFGFKVLLDRFLQ